MPSGVFEFVESCVRRRSRIKLVAVRREEDVYVLKFIRSKRADQTIESLLQ